MKYLIYFFILFSLLDGWISSVEANMVISSESRPSRWSLSYLGTMSQEGLGLAKTRSLKENYFFSSTNTLFLDYLLNDRTAIGFVGVYELAPIELDKSFPYNPEFRISDRKLIATSYVSLTGDLRFTLPVNWSTSLSRQKVVMGVRSTGILNVLFPHSRFSLRSFNYVKFQQFGQIGLGKAFIYYSRTNTNYRLNRKLSLSAISLYSLSKSNSRKKSSVATDFFRFGPGVQWDLSDQSRISPYLTYNFEKETAGLGFYAVVQLRVL